MNRADFRGIYTVVYRVPDLAAAKRWYAAAFGTEPYFDEPFYVGFDIGGYELGLLPEEGDSRAGRGGVVAYFGAPSADAAYEALLAAGARPVEPVTDVGGGVRTASVLDPFGNEIGVVENPGFAPRG